MVSALFQEREGRKLILVECLLFASCTIDLIFILIVCMNYDNKTIVFILHALLIGAVCSVTSDSMTQWTVTRQAPLSMGFPKQEYWSGLPFPSPGTLPTPGIELASPALASRFFTTEPPGKPQRKYTCNRYLNFF